MSITHYLISYGFYSFEGHSQQIERQVHDLIYLSKGSPINIMEIGFNAGHSAEIFLKSNPGSILTSFDLGIHDYVHAAKEYINSMYPNRHTLILGDSTVTVPQYIYNHPNKSFDVIFIDGGHEYHVVQADLENCRKLAHKDTIIIMDDTMYTTGWEQGYTTGPTKAWVEYLEKGIIKEIYRADYQIGRGMSWGKYVF